MNSYKIQQVRDKAVDDGVDITGLNAHEIHAAIQHSKTIPTGKQLFAMGHNLSPTIAPAVLSTWDGEKFSGGFGLTKLLAPDYWTLRARSEQLFETNLYARGLIRRLVTNEINTGLWPEAMPDEDTLGLAEGDLDDWSEDIENRFTLWGKTPTACDFKKIHTFNKLQAITRREALVGGDCLIVLQQDPITKRPSVMIIKGQDVRTPMEFSGGENRKIIHGVEVDNATRHIAFHVVQKDGKSKRIPAVSGRNGRRVAWLVYGTDHRVETVRGTPLLGLILQSLAELDKYRDSTQRAAVVNSMLAMFIKKGEDKPGSKSITAGAVRRSTSVINDLDDCEINTGPRTLALNPGLVLEELQQGEEPVAFQPNVGVDLGKFEEIITSAIAWANEIPPEILRLAFSNNYSASQAAINEFKIYLNMSRTDFGEQFNAPIYQEWIISEALLGKIDRSDEILNAWRDKANFEIFTAWLLAEWSGAIKLSTDILKQAKGYALLLEMGWITNARATRETTGQKFSRNMRKIRREEELLALARPATVEPKQNNPNVTNAQAMRKLENTISALQDTLNEIEANSNE